METFTVTLDHIKLLRNAYVSWWGLDFGAPTIDPTRPYGDGDVGRSIIEVLEIKGLCGYDSDGEETTSYTKKQIDYVKEVHKQTKTALQIFLVTGTMVTGKYQKLDEYCDISWTKV